MDQLLTSQVSAIGAILLGAFSAYTPVNVLLTTTKKEKNDTQLSLLEEYTRLGDGIILLRTRRSQSRMCSEGVSYGIAD